MDLLNHSQRRWSKTNCRDAKDKCKERAEAESESESLADTRGMPRKTRLQSGAVAAATGAVEAAWQNFGNVRTEAAVSVAVC
jgi:hypothetical protein